MIGIVVANADSQKPQSVLGRQGIGIQGHRKTVLLTSLSLSLHEDFHWMWSLCLKNTILL